LAFPRHFLILASFAVLMGCLSRSAAAPGLLTAFALYGSLHGAALVLASKNRRLRWQNGCFIVVAGALSALTLTAGMHAWPLAAILPDTLRRYALLALSAVSGAAIYGIAIRVWGILPLTPRAIALVAGGCMLAAVLGLLTVKAAGAASAWWIAVSWWFALSIGLWRFNGSPPSRAVG
jgi:hypothetical protein